MGSTEGRCCVITVTLDAHPEVCQMAVVTEQGELVYERKVETTPEELRRAVGGVPGPKRVVFIAARAAVKGKNALAERYQARLDAGWEKKKAIRDARRRARRTSGGANSKVRPTLRKRTFHGAGGIVFLLSPFIDAGPFIIVIAGDP